MHWLAGTIRAACLSLALVGSAAAQDITDQPLTGPELSEAYRRHTNLARVGIPFYVAGAALTTWSTVVLMNNYDHPATPETITPIILGSTVGVFSLLGGSGSLGFGTWKAAQVLDPDATAGLGTMSLVLVGVGSAVFYAYALVGPTIAVLDPEAFVVIGAVPVALLGLSGVPGLLQMGINDIKARRLDVAVLPKLGRGQLGAQLAVRF